MFYFIVAVSLVLFATLVETLILAGNDWKTSKFTPVYNFLVNTVGMNGFCEAFWNVVILYTLTITTFILVGYYGYGWYHIFTGVSSKFVDFTVVTSFILFIVFMLFIVIIVIPIIINKIKKLFLINLNL